MKQIKKNLYSPGFQEEEDKCNPIYLDFPEKKVGLIPSAQGL